MDEVMLCFPKTISSSELEDKYVYILYDLDLRIPHPLLTRKSQLISAVVNSQVDLLRELLDSPKWYNVRDSEGNNLLQIAILSLSQETFDFLLTLPDFPLEHVNKKKETALMIALGCEHLPEYFAYQLLQNGASYHWVSGKGETPLQRAITNSYINVALFLLERGVDVNFATEERYRPLELAVESHRPLEYVAALLAYGAEATSDTFQAAVWKDCPTDVQDILFMYVSDLILDSEISFLVILQLAKQESPYFDELIKYPLKIKMVDCTYSFHLLLTIKKEYFKKIVKRFGFEVGEILRKCNLLGVDEFSKENINIENLDLLMQSNCRADVIDTICNIDSYSFFFNYVTLNSDETKITELYCYLLSYGFILYFTDLEHVYTKYGYCELFKIMLHMEIKPCDEGNPRDLIPLFIYDMNISFQKFLKGSFCFSLGSVEEFTHYFAHQKVIDAYDELVQNFAVEKRELPQLPSLVELARNEFRDYFIKTFDIRTSRKFYTLLKRLPISETHEKIISFETKLY